MILRYDRLGVEIPAGDRDLAAGMAVQELMSGRFGEMSTLMNYTLQSFGFRGRKELRRSPTTSSGPLERGQHPESEGMSDEERGALERSAATLRPPACRINARGRVARQGRT